MLAFFDAHPWIAGLCAFLGASIVIPTVLHLGKNYFKAKREAQAAELGRILAGYALKDATSELFEKMEAVQQTRHMENKGLLDTIRKEGNTREGLIRGEIGALADQVRQESRDRGQAVSGIHTQLIDLAKLMGNRRSDLG